LLSNEAITRGAGGLAGFGGRCGFGDFEFENAILARATGPKPSESEKMNAKRCDSHLSLSAFLEEDLKKSGGRVSRWRASVQINQESPSEEGRSLNDDDRRFLKRK